MDYHLSPLADHVLKTEPRPLEEVRANMQLLQTAYNSPDRTIDDDLVEALAGGFAATERDARADRFPSGMRPLTVPAIPLPGQSSQRATRG